MWIRPIDNLSIGKLILVITEYFLSIKLSNRYWFYLLTFAGAIEELSGLIAGASRAS